MIDLYIGTELWRKDFPFNPSPLDNACLVNVDTRKNGYLYLYFVRREAGRGKDYELCNVRPVKDEHLENWKRVTT